MFFDLRRQLYSQIKNVPKKPYHQPLFTPKICDCNPPTAVSILRKRCRQAGGTLCGYLLAFPLLSFRLSCFTLSLPFPELPLTFFAFVVGEDVGEDAPGDVLDFVLRNTGIVDELLLAAQAGWSLRFDIKF